MPISLFRFSMFALLITLYSCAPSDQDGWTDLIQNADLSDFEILNGEATYRLEENTLIGTTKANTPNTFLATKAHYGDFELRFDVLLTEGLNAGVQIRSISSPEIHEGRVHGYQVEIEDSPRGWAGGIYDESRRGWLYPLTYNTNGRKAFKKGEWNHYHIIAKGSTIRTWVNGIACANLTDTLTHSGLIGFQVHSIGDANQANKTISWRNIQIKTTQVGAELPYSDTAPATSIFGANTNSTAEFVLADGSYIHQLAGEPQVQSPVTAALDKNGSLWVVELPGYMRDIDGSEENRPDGRITILSDINADGVMDRQIIYKDQLIAPRAICLAYNGLLYNSGKTLYFADFQTGETTVVDTSYVVGENIEHQPNGLYFNIDNWIYNAKSATKYRLRKGVWEKAQMTVRGQWGLTADLHGRLIYNDNSNGLMGDRLPPATINRNHHSTRPVYYDVLCDDNRVYPLQATAVNRGYIDGVLDDEDKLTHFTSACGPAFYKGQGPWYRNAFTCGPEANLIKRYELKDSQGPFGQAFRQTYQGSEFLVSKEETFRPVTLFGHPNGGLFVVDMRKGIIQHRAYMTHYLREKIVAKALDTVVNKGRIYLLSHYPDSIPPLELWALTAPNSKIVELLNSPNGSMRLAAQQHLLAQADSSTVQDILLLYSNAGTYGKIHCLWTLEGLNSLDNNWFSIINEEQSPEVLYHILLLMDRYPALIDRELIERVAKLRHPELDLQLCHLLLIRGFEAIWADLMRRYSQKEAYAVAMAAQLPLDSPLASGMVKTQLQAISNRMEEAKQNPQQDRPVDDRTVGYQAFTQHCASCHGMDGSGQPNLAPPILYSEYVEGPSDKLAALILLGMKGPVTLNGTSYDLNLMMPGYKHNPAIDDETIAAIIAFVNNAFSRRGEGISPEKVAAIRAQVAEREEPLTAEEMLNW